MEPSSSIALQSAASHTPASLEKLSGIVERVTFHSPETGWTVIQVSPFRAPETRVTVTLHQAKVFAGASADFLGEWTEHPKYGEQFKCHQMIERKPASAAALEKYLGSGLIFGVGPKTARKIVKHFGDETLAVFEGSIERLKEVQGIAERKLETIAAAWSEHQAIRLVMMFLQEHGISTLFAVKIYQAYGDRAIEIVEGNPYRLAKDIYGIGFFGADRIAASLGFDPHGAPRLDAGIAHVLAASREQGHCFLTAEQVTTQTVSLLDLAEVPEAPLELARALEVLAAKGEVRVRTLPMHALRRERAAEPPKARPEERETGEIRERGGEATETEPTRVRCYYSRSLFRAEAVVAREIQRRVADRRVLDRARVERWLEAYCERSGLNLSDEQRAAVRGITGRGFAILTGGPGCGKTTTTRAVVRLALAMGERVMLAAPTGRAAQRMSEVVGREAKTLHRLLEWNPSRNGFARDRENPLATDFLVVDETSMLDITLAASLLEATPESARILFVGDPDQLPSVGAGDVLADLLRTKSVARYALREVFRQARASSIVRHAHEIQRGVTPRIPSPIAAPELWRQQVDCLFLDAEEATQEQLRFVRRAKAVIEKTHSHQQSHLLISDGQAVGWLEHAEGGVAVRPAAPDRPEADAEIFSIPKKFLSVDLERLAQTRGGVAEIREVLGRIHPDSVLHYDLSLVDAVRRLYTRTLPEKLGRGVEIQILCPMNRGRAGAVALNRIIQEAVTPAAPGRAELRFADRVLRVGDRVLQRRNNYQLGVFNGDIGRIVAADAEEMTCQVEFRAGGRSQIVSYTKADLVELSLAYAITVHKSQGSEFDAVIIPIVTQHYRMLFRGLVYTGLTRAKKLAIFVGERRALALAVANTNPATRQTALDFLIEA